MKDYKERSEEVRQALAPLVDMGWEIVKVETDETKSEPFRVVVYMEYDAYSSRSII